MAKDILTIACGGIAVFKVLNALDEQKSLMRAARAELAEVKRTVDFAKRDVIFELRCMKRCGAAKHWDAYAQCVSDLTNPPPGTLAAAWHVETKRRLSESFTQEP